MPSRLIADLAPVFRPIAERIVDGWQIEGLDILVTCTLRTADEQAALYAQGRTKPGRIVTYRQPGTSMHERGLALDFVPLVQGKAMWKHDPMDPHDPWKLAAQVAMAVHPNVQWGGQWRRLRDLPHLEWRS